MILNTAISKLSKSANNFPHFISDACGQVTNSTQTILVGWSMRGNRHTGCLAGFAHGYAYTSQCRQSQDKLII